MENFYYSAFLKDKTQITLWEIREYFWFIHIADIRNIINNVLLFNGATRMVGKSSGTIQLNKERINYILVWIQKWNKDQEKTIMQKSQQIKPQTTQGIASIKWQDIPAEYISTIEAIKKYWQARVLGPLSKERLTTQTFHGKKYLSESQLIACIDSDAKKVQQKSRKPTKTSALWQEYLRLYKWYLDS